MTTIGDRIAVLMEELEITSTAELERGGRPKEDPLLSNGQISKWVNKTVEWTTGKLEEFLDHYKVNRQWWKTGKGDILIKNSTDGENEATVAQKAPLTAVDLLAVLQDVLAERSDYRIIPKTVLDGEYRLLPKSEIEQRAKELESRTKELEDIRRERIETMDAKNKLIKRLEDEVAELRSRNPITPQGA